MEPKTSVSPEDQQKIKTFARLFDSEQQLEVSSLCVKRSDDPVPDPDCVLDVVEFYIELYTIDSK